MWSAEIVTPANEYLSDCGTASVKVLLRSLEPATDHACLPEAAARVAAAMSQGYHECFHEAHLFAADIRATVLRRIGYQTLLEPACAGWLVLARATPISPKTGSAEVLVLVLAAEPATATDTDA
jgi:hypothetical protein